MIYNITYNGLKGATNSNPATYDDSGSDITLVDPTNLENKHFLGWYTELPGENKITVIDPTVAAEIADGSDIVLYAFYIEIELVGNYVIIPQTSYSDRATAILKDHIISVIPKRFQTTDKGKHVYKIQLVANIGTQIYLLDTFTSLEQVLEARDVYLTSISA